MTETVYADILFVINFSMDVLSLYIAAKITSQKIYTFRIIFGGIIGGLYGVISLFIPLDGALCLPISIAVGAVVVVSGLKCQAGKNFIISCVLFFVAGGTLSGIMTAIMTVTGRIDNSGAINLSPRAFALCALISAVLTLFTGRIFSFNGRIGKVDVKISDGNEEFCAKALVDSGNLVREPISGRPCIIVRIEDVKNVIPSDLYREIIYGGNDLSRLSAETLMRTRLIPIKGVGESKIMLAYRPKQIEINKNGQTKTVEAFLLIDGTLGDEKYGGEAMIVPLSIL